MKLRQRTVASLIFTTLTLFAPLPTNAGQNRTSELMSAGLVSLKQPRLPTRAPGSRKRRQRSKRFSRRNPTILMHSFIPARRS